MEVSAAKGKGLLKTTGNLGKVLDESIKVAMSYIRCSLINNEIIKELDKLNRLENTSFLDNHDFHIHF